MSDVRFLLFGLKPLSRHKHWHRQGAVKIFPPR
jgi:hypothetical protein